MGHISRGKITATWVKDLKTVLARHCDVHSTRINTCLHTCATKGLNGKEFTLLHFYALLPSSHYGNTFATMNVVCTNGVAIEIPDTLDLQNQLTSSFQAMQMKPRQLNSKPGLQQLSGKGLAM